MSDLRRDLIDFAGTLERHGDEDAAALVLRAGASIAELEAGEARKIAALHEQTNHLLERIDELEASRDSYAKRLGDVKVEVAELEAALVKAIEFIRLGPGFTPGCRPQNEGEHQAQLLADELEALKEQGE